MEDGGNGRLVHVGPGVATMRKACRAARATPPPWRLLRGRWPLALRRTLPHAFGAGRVGPG